MLFLDGRLDSLKSRAAWFEVTIRWVCRSVISPMPLSEDASWFIYQYWFSFRRLTRQYAQPHFSNISETSVHWFRIFHFTSICHFIVYFLSPWLTINFIYQLQFMPHSIFLCVSASKYINILLLSLIILILSKWRRPSWRYSTYILTRCWRSATYYFNYEWGPR